MKHLRTKATDITKQVRMIVAERDNGQCIFCDKFGIPNAHYIKRSKGGLGIPENIFTACPQCHFEQDFGKNAKELTRQARDYLKGYYGDSWNEDKLIYKKGRD